MSKPLLLCSSFLILFMFRVSAQEKLTDFTSGMWLNYFEGTTEFQGQLYGFQSSNFYDLVLWRYNPASLTCDTIYRANPKVNRD